uniref:Heat shock protein 70 n=1 Tax=Panagrolaimus sp. ES5 TaxID=591445 RepID=A0AC34FKK7_9BILA
MAGEITLYRNVPNADYMQRNMKSTSSRKSSAVRKLSPGAKREAQTNISFLNSVNYSTEENDAKRQEFTSTSRRSVLPNIIEYNSYTLPTKIVTNNDQIKAVGIDLGTSRCCAAVNRRNGIETVVLDNNGERLLPSYVAFDEVHVKCGQIVVDRLRYHSNSTIFDSKRIIGKKLEDIEVDENWPFVLKFVMNKAFIEHETFNKSKTRKTPEQIAAILLTHIKQKSEEFQEKQLNNVVITVPAAFTNDQKEATILAATLAGWDSVHLLPEPTAAAFTYFLERPIPKSCILLVFDLGGGTLDICISKIESNKIQTIANSGDQKLGGRDFDNLLIDYFVKKLYDGYGISVDGGKKYKLMLECQKIKHYLSLRDQEQ